MSDSRSMQKIFQDIFLSCGWGGDESVSGPGSGLARTAVFRNQIGILLREVGARSLLDAGCGDFNWMKATEMDIDNYIGVDLVPELIRYNSNNYANSRRRFLCLDLTRDPLPGCDVILSRDCLVHLSFGDVRAALRNFQQCGSKYLMATTFVSHKNV